jgi:hypothetical protein
MAQATLRDGDHCGQRPSPGAKALAKMLTATEGQDKALTDEWLDAAMICKIEWQREPPRRKRHGITDLSDPQAHPDHVKTDRNMGPAGIAVPAKKEKKAQYDLRISRKAAFGEELDQQQIDLVANANPKMKTMLEVEVGRIEKALQIIGRLLPDLAPDPKKRRVPDMSASAHLVGAS